MPFDVISFGSAIVDIFLQSDNFKVVDEKEGKLVCQAYGRKIEVDKRTVCSGGGGTNTAVSFARQGLKSASVALLGADIFGQFIRSNLEKENVSCRFLVEGSEPTDTSIILIGPKGTRTIMVCRGDTRLEISHLNWGELKAKWFYITSLEGNLDLVEKLIGFADKHNMQISWNPGKKELKNRKKVRNLVSKTSVFNLNRKEMEELIGKRLGEETFWQTVRDLDAPLTVVTNGRSGAYLLYDQGLHFLPSPDTQPVDETGAGDAFGSGFVSGLIKGKGEKEAFNLAMKNGASVVQHVGAKKGLLKNPKVQNFNTQN